VGSQTYTFVTTLTAANQVLAYTSSSSTTQESRTADNLEAAINLNSSQCYASPCYGTGTTINTSASATLSSSTLTLTAKTTGHAGNFAVATNVQSGFYIYVGGGSNGAGPGYVSNITVTAGGAGYQSNAPCTLTGGGGTGAICVAGQAYGTPPATYQPAFGATVGWDFATGIGSINATNLALNSAW
jgi:hypothetical protein